MRIACAMPTIYRLDWNPRPAISSFRRAFPSEQLLILSEPATPRIRQEGVDQWTNDVRRGALGNYLHAVRQLIQTGADWLLVLEDDVELCRSAGVRLADGITQNPGAAALSLYSPWVEGMFPEPAGWSRHDLGRRQWGTQAVAIRRDVAALWLTAAPTYRATAADTMLWGWLAEHQFAAYFHSPSLAEHLCHGAGSGHTIHYGYRYDPMY
jgi:hypothetical protein